MVTEENTVTSLLSYKDVKICHGDYLVIEGVTMNVNTGDFIFLTGNTGTGKSSIIRTVYGDMKISDGEATALGFNLRTLRKKQIPELRKQLGIIFQDYKLLGNMTIGQNLAFCLKATGLRDKAKIEERIASVMEKVSLDNKDKYPSELSGGEQQRAAIARAIINSPRIILADEPTGSLDKESSIAITSLLRDLTASGTAVIMSTHSNELINMFDAEIYLCEDHKFSQIKA